MEKKMKNKLNRIVFVLVCGMMLTSCGGDSGKSGLKKNPYLGSLPAIYAGYNAEKKAHEAKVEEQGQKLMAGGEKNADKIMKLMMEEQETAKAMKEKMKTAVSAEIAKIAGKEIPVSYSKALLDSDELFYNVAPLKLVGNKEELVLVISLSAKSDFEVPRMKGYDYSTYFRFITSDGSTITKSVLLPVKLDYKPFSIAAGESLLENNFPLHLNNQPELYVDFAGIEFITKAEYDAK